MALTKLALILSGAAKAAALLTRSTLDDCRAWGRSYSSTGLGLLLDLGGGVVYGEAET